MPGNIEEGYVDVGCPLFDDQGFDELGLSGIDKYYTIRPNKIISVFGVTGLKILGRVGTHIFFFN